MTGVIDKENCIIRGVSLITGDCIAEGHDLHVDGQTLTQLHALAASRGKVPVGLDHGHGIAATCGYMTDFRLDGNKLRGDWHLLKSHDETPRMLERAETHPEGWGMSCAFKGQGVATSGGKKAARAEKLLSVDAVTRPAANDGLFSAKDSQSVDKFTFSNSTNMADKKDSNAEPTIADLMAAINQQNERFEQLSQSHEQLIGQLQGQGEEGQEQGQPSVRDILEDLHNSTDEDLAARGLTRDEVNAEIGQYNQMLAQGIDPEAAMGGEGEAQGYEGDQGYQGSYSPEQGQQAGAPAVGAGVEGGTATTFNALQRQVMQLSAAIRARDNAEKAQSEEIQFSEVSGKIDMMANMRDRAVELAERLVSENEALRLAVNTGTRPVRPGIDNGVRLFSANGDGQLHAFQASIKEIQLSEKCSTGQATLKAIQRNPGLHADWLQKSGSMQLAN